MHKQGTTYPTHIIAIGASAGGLEALQGLFEAMPDNLGVAFVIVQHLSPDFKSMMGELLSKHTKMPTHQAREGEELVSNTIYLIPAGKFMRVAEGHLYLSDVPVDHRVNLPINELFRSLAVDKNAKTVAIVLSGTGSDGSRGISALKESGGLVIVQDPKEAVFSGMPENAINTGSVDFVLPVAEIPKRISEYLNYPFTNNTDKDFQAHLFEHSETLENVLKLIQDKTNLDFKAYKETTVSRRIEHRMNINGIASLGEYYQFLKKKPEEIDFIKQDLLIGVTQFFRDTDVWDALNEKVIKELLLSSAIDQPIRIWCAGCSTGEEAYTIAMLVTEAMVSLNIIRQVKIFASDIDQTAVAFAASGIYSGSISAEVPTRQLSAHFTPRVDGSFQVTKQLRSMVVFATHNLIQDPPFSNMDIVTCRNALIYFQTPAQQKTLAFFHFSLKLGGHLLLGSAESTGSFSNYFSVVDAKLRIYKKDKELRIPVTTVSQPNFRNPGYKPSSVPQFIARSKRTAIEDKPKNLPWLTYLISEYVPLTLVMNYKMQVIYSYGESDVFTKKIPPGAITNEISHILISDVLSEALRVSHRVIKDSNSILVTNVFSNEEGAWSLKAKSIKDPNTSEDYIILSFIQNNEAKNLKADLVYDRTEQEVHRIEELEESLLVSQRLYHEAMEDLDTSSEELQSSNEELMAANEELQSTNEELQSVNEELYTVNSEYQQKISELTDTNTDLENLLQSTRLAVLFLSSDLTIRRFTQEMQKFVNIMNFDIHRDFRDLKFKYEIPNLIAMVDEVNGHNATASEIIEAGSIILEVNVTPYLSCGRPNGVVVSIREVIN